MKIRSWQVPRADLGAAGVALALVTVASVVGGLLYLSGHPVYAISAPFTGSFSPHLGVGTPLALIVAALVVLYGPRLAEMLTWRRLLVAAYGSSVAWILSLAMIDGWHRGIADRLTTSFEYLSEVGGVTSVPTMLRTFASRILDFQPHSWTTHVSGHPPGAFLVFIGLDRIGLGGGAWAGLFCIAVGAAATVAVPVTLRALGDENSARVSLPFLVLFPGAVWIGVSADGMFTGVTATGLAWVAIALTRRNVVAGLAGGLLLGYSIYLSYGLTLIGVLALAVLILARRVGPLPIVPLIAAVAGAITVVVAFTLAGFWWLTGYHLVIIRYYQGVATVRPYWYWVWGDLAAVVACAGPVAAVVIRRGARSTKRLSPTVLLPAAGLVAILAADLSGYSKAEVERIWLPFAVWLSAGVALLPKPSRRGWLIAQAVTALLANHLLLTTW